MKIKVSVLLNIFLSVALVVSIAASLTGAVDYDPWLDVNDDGYGGIDDIVSTAEHFGASGNPAKLCNVTSLPTHDEITVFWQEYAEPSSAIGSDWYEASGFGRIHLIVHAFNLVGAESVDIVIHGRFWDPTHSFYAAFPYYTITLTESTGYRMQTLSVPSESFNFAIYTDSISSGQVSLSFYLTWA